MVVSGSEVATRAGAQILGDGGNAVDAAVATAFALAVAEPTQSGLGGRTQALIWRPDGSAFGIDATTEVPVAYDPDSAAEVEDGYGVVAIPGTVAGLARLLDEAGSMPLSRVIEPALRLAEGGFELSEGEAARLEGVRDRLLLSDGAREAFLKPDGSAYRAGEVLRQPALAAVLRSIGEEGPEVFYRGSVAARMVADFEARDAHVAASDLANYVAEPSIVVRGHFGELELVGTYLPASGATTIEALQILDRVDLSDMGPDAAAFAIGRALLMAFEDRDTAWEDERPHVEDAAWTVSRELADVRAAQLVGVGAVTPSGAERPEAEHTTHLSVVDADGMAVAMTQSLGLTGGSRVATPGLGFLYAATLGGYLGYVEPGDRPWSSQSPIVAVRDDRLDYVLGGAGSRRIISALVQTLVRTEVLGSSLEDAVAGARFHPSTTSWTFEVLPGSQAEPPGVAAARAAGYEVRTQDSDVYFARLNVLSRNPNSGRYTGVADPRWRWGAASGPRLHAGVSNEQPERR
jgi:gamma-glutamyltranspeptidase/glutathione hydrolase